METLSNVAATVTNTVTNTVSKTIWGDQTQNTTQDNETGGAEPLSGHQGKGTATDPYDQGNTDKVDVQENPTSTSTGLTNSERNDLSPDANLNTHTSEASPSTNSRSESQPSALSLNPKPETTSSTFPLGTSTHDDKHILSSGSDHKQDNSKVTSITSPFSTNLESNNSTTQTHPPILTTSNMPTFTSVNAGKDNLLSGSHKPESTSHHRSEEATSHHKPEEATSHTHHSHIPTFTGASAGKDSLLLGSHKLEKTSHHKSVEDNSHAHSSHIPAFTGTSTHKDDSITGSHSNRYGSENTAHAPTSTTGFGSNNPYSDIISTTPGSHTHDDHSTSTSYSKPTTTGLSSDISTNPFHATTSGEHRTTQRTGNTDALEHSLRDHTSGIVPPESSHPGVPAMSGEAPQHMHQGADRPYDAPSGVQTQALKDSKAHAEEIMTRRDPHDHSGEPMRLHDSSRIPTTQEERRESKVGMPGGQEHGKEPRGTGEQWVKTSGVHAQGGDFDATKPGAGREADRLMEKGVARDEVTHGHHSTDGHHNTSGHHTTSGHHATSSTEQTEQEKEKTSVAEKLKAKLHIGHHHKDK